MANEQKIYGSYRFPLGETTCADFFAEYRESMVLNEQGLQISGIGVARDVSRNIAILMTYDEESDLMLRLRFAGNIDVQQYNRD